MQENEMSLSRKTRLDKTYQIKKVLSKSETSIVYAVRHVKSGQMYAIKECFPRSLALRGLDRRTMLCRKPSLEKQYEEQLSIFEQEAKLLQEVKHPNIVQLHDQFRENGTSYMVLEYCKGLTLDQYIQNEGHKLSSRFLSLTMTALISAVERIHKHHILHRDLKPENVIIGADGQPKLIDFGSAVRIQQVKVPKYPVMTSTGYSPIEMYSERSRQDKLVDIYSLSAILYYCFCGNSPMDVKQRLFQDDLVPIRAFNPSISPLCARIIHWGLAVNAKDRCSSLQWFKRAMQAEGLMRRGKIRFSTASKASKVKKQAPLKVSNRGR